MARTIRTKVYQFNELSDNAKKVAIEKERESYYQDGEPLMFFEDYCSEKVAEYGFNDCKFQWRLSCSQGDGLSFSCTEFNVKQFLTNNTRLHKESVINAITNNCVYEIKGNTGHYCYASKSDIDFYLDANKEYPNIESIVSLVKTEIQNTYLQLCKELEDAGYRWIDAENEDAAIIERIEENDYEFTADGRRF